MNWNAVTPFVDATPKELQDAAGITQFVGADGWYQTINGLLVQGGKANIISNSTTGVSFNVAFQSQVLFVFTQAISGGAGNGYVNVFPGSVALDMFVAQNTGNSKDFYWLALGV